MGKSNGPSSLKASSMTQCLFIQCPAVFFFYLDMAVAYNVLSLYLLLPTLYFLPPSPPSPHVNITGVVHKTAACLPACPSWGLSTKVTSVNGHVQVGVGVGWLSIHRMIDPQTPRPPFVPISCAFVISVLF